MFYFLLFSKQIRNSLLFFSLFFVKLLFRDYISIIVFIWIYWQIYPISYLYVYKLDYLIWPIYSLINCLWKKKEKRMKVNKQFIDNWLMIYAPCYYRYYSVKIYPLPLFFKEKRRIINILNKTLVSNYKCLHLMNLSNNIKNIYYVFSYLYRPF